MNIAVRSTVVLLYIQPCALYFHAVVVIGSHAPSAFLGSATRLVSQRHPRSLLRQIRAFWAILSVHLTVDGAAHQVQMTCTHTTETRS
ncbi:hypothetical protein BKA62DRAFT_58883 [Auriculariales sp. MPI-PUGE-AT-0066]|nr:hypothetical protein BKA62DRAFT_58883 [Auriculariales sp. MPI-PUGE-AT-0066]